MATEHDPHGEAATKTRTKSKPEVARPRLFKVLMHNDDYTTRDFVVEVLEHVFRMSEQEAVRVMLHVHYTGIGVAGVFTREVAETKIEQVQRLAQQNEFPLMLTMEPEEDDS